MSILKNKNSYLRSCGREQEHHAHSDSCSCNLEHHRHSDSCSCNLEHHAHSDSCSCNLEHHRSTDIRFVFLLEHLGCANCASKMEMRINSLPEVTSASLTFTTKQLRVFVSPQAVSNETILLQKIQDICTSIESQVVVSKLEVSSKDIKVESSKYPFSQKKVDLYSVLVGAFLFIAGELLEHLSIGSYFILPIYILSYLILGGKIVLTAGKNLLKGQIFDENFLMSIATLGAFAIQEYPEAVGVMLFYRIGTYFEEIAVERSRSQIMEVVDLRPEVVTIITNTGITVIPAKQAQLNDVLLVHPGDRIPLDGEIVEGESRLDTSPITGEPVPVRVVVGDKVTSGCINTSGQLKIRVENILKDSMVTRILDSVENAAASKPQIHRFITRFARVYTPFVVITALSTALIPSILTGNWSHWIYAALTFLVISCPCALVLSVPLAFFSGIGAGSKKGILFKGGVSMEALHKVTTVVMDKTGTITKGNFVVQHILTFSTYTPKEILTFCAQCEQTSTHPIAVSIVSAAKEQELCLPSALTLKEIAGYGMEASFPIGTLLVGNQKLMEKHKITMNDSSKNNYGTQVFLAINGVLAGSLIIADTIKTEAAPAISALKKMQITTIMLTGDTQSSANEVATSTGIDEVYARLLPEDKLNILQEIRKRNGSVMFVGDGINDAPVLAGANVGAAMGSGADAAIEAADVVFMTSNMLAVPQSISIARATNKIAWQNVIFALIIKSLVMILGLTGHASMWMAVFADSGVAMLCVLNSIRLLYKK
ncbi:MAG: heavy metal translocating P-type ATPase [Lachnospiraceae bacterium]